MMYAKILPSLILGLLLPNSLHSGESWYRGTNTTTGEWWDIKYPSNLPDVSGKITGVYHSRSGVYPLIPFHLNPRDNAGTMVYSNREAVQIRYIKTQDDVIYSLVGTNIVRFFLCDKQ